MNTNLSFRKNMLSETNIISIVCRNWNAWGKPAYLNKKTAINAMKKKHHEELWRYLTYMILELYPIYI